MAIQPRSRSESGGSSKKPISISSGSEVGGSDIDPNFRSIVIYVYRNGDEFDKGVEVTITRKAFKHWLNLLEYLTKRCNTTKPVNFIYKLTGEAIKGFKQLEDGGEYVAASGPFKSCRYRSKAKKDFKVDPHQIRRKDPPALDSSESLEMFLRRTGYHKGKDAKYPEDIFEDTSLDLRSKNTSRLPSQKNGNGPPSSIGSSIVKPTAVRPPIATINNPKVTDAKFGRNAGVMDKYLTNQPQIPHRNLSQLRYLN